MTSSNGDLDPYRVLGVRADASDDVVRAAYRALMRRFHPDAPGGDPARARQVNDAWAVLSDPVRRAAYDRAHTSPPVVPAPPARDGGATRGRPQGAAVPRPRRPRRQRARHRGRRGIRPDRYVTAVAGAAAAFTAACAVAVWFAGPRLPEAGASLCLLGGAVWLVAARRTGAGVGLWVLAAAGFWAARTDTGAGWWACAVGLVFAAAVRAWRRDRWRRAARWAERRFRQTVRDTPGASVWQVASVSDTADPRRRVLLVRAEADGHPRSVTVWGTPAPGDLLLLDDEPADTISRAVLPAEVAATVNGVRRRAARAAHRRTHGTFLRQARPTRPPHS